MKTNWFKKITKHKGIEFNLYRRSLDRGFTFCFLQLETRWRTDHGGIFFELIFLNYGFDWQFYDGRHWNDEKNRYETDEEIAAEIEEYKRREAIAKLAEEIGKRNDSFEEFWRVGLEKFVVALGSAKEIADDFDLAKPFMREGWEQVVAPQLENE
jgi:hypothetical protein